MQRRRRRRRRAARSFVYGFCYGRAASVHKNSKLNCDPVSSSMTARPHHRNSTTPPSDHHRPGGLCTGRWRRAAQTAVPAAAGHPRLGAILARCGRQLRPAGCQGRVRFTFRLESGARAGGGWNGAETLLRCGAVRCGAVRPPVPLPAPRSGQGGRSPPGPPLAGGREGVAERWCGRRPERRIELRPRHGCGDILYCARRCATVRDC
jgi:hypothetical protein